jgi:cell wall-associated protease
MKKYLIAALAVFPDFFAHSQIQISNNKWYAHTEIPRSADLELTFKNDSFLIRMQNGRGTEAMLFSQHNDSLYIRKINGGTPCNDGSEGWYKIEWVKNGESFLLHNINDPCPQRVNFFTQLKLTGKTNKANEVLERQSYASIKDDSVPGINLYGAYKLLKGRKSQTVIVAVTGGGIDRNHEDLKDVMWTNTKEIPANGIDDDKNGYVDDIWGWNFISDKKGNTVTRLQRDVTQIYKLWKNRYENADRSKLKPEEKEEYDIYQKAKKEWAEKNQFVEAFKLTLADSARFFQTLKEFADQTSYDRMPRPTFVSFQPGADPFKTAVKKVLLSEFFVQNDSIVLGRMLQNLPQRWQNYKWFATGFIKDFDLEYESLKIIGDDPLNVYEHNYGSPFLIKVPEIEFNHDTHIAGIIGAKRDNGKGIDGIADNVKIMMVKAMTGGDERDKDIANAIRYAVDNGAKVINMSWGKRYSSHKQVVDDAVRYAEEHDVLLVHGAGNDGNDCDTVDYYPTAKFRNGKFAQNLVQVGCSRTSYDSHLPAWYSNYGHNTVDLFAPGENSYGPLPNNEYGYAGGTSNAAPFVVGVAALLKSYFPQLTMIQIKNIILETTYRPDIKVIRPHPVNPAFSPAVRMTLANQGELVPFSSLSKTGGILDAEAAVRKAIELTKK